MNKKKRNNLVVNLYGNGTYGGSPAGTGGSAGSEAAGPPPQKADGGPEL